MKESNCQVRWDRLERLLEHMEAGELSVDGWDYGAFHREERDRAGQVCGTAGCMGGELVGLWPEEWELRMTFDGSWIPRRVRGEGEPEDGGLFSGFIEDAEDFFGLNWNEVRHLFYPDPVKGYGAGMVVPGLVRCGRGSTRAAVAGKLLEFLEWKRARVKAVRASFAEVAR